MTDRPNEEGRCCKGSGCCGRETSRREFLKLAGLAAAAAALADGALGESAPPPDLATLVPADKKLKADWLASLTARGEPAVYRGDDLKFIGMPVGGLCAGQLYLGGDGRLWHWDIFNKHAGTGAGRYAKPMDPASPLEQGFAIRVTAGEKKEIRALDRTGFADVSFRGEYPIGYVEYRDPASAVSVSLEAFSPFVPLSVEDSSLPATVMRFTVKNTSAAKVEAELAGWLENAVCLHSGQPGMGVRRNRLVPGEKWFFLECTAEALPPEKRPAKRPDIVFDNFEKDSYEGWTATGTAFGSGPVEIGKIPDYQGDVAGKGKRVVNSHASAPGGSVAEKDAATGTLTSKTFTLERNYITFLIGGGSHKGKTCMNLLVDNKAVLSATGKNDNKMEPANFDVRKWAGKAAKLVIVDDEKGGWGNIGIDNIVFSDEPHGGGLALAEQADFGSMGMAILERDDGGQGAASAPGGPRPASVFSDAGLASDPAAEKPFGQKLVGALARRFSLEPGKEAVTTFVVAWHFPNLKVDPVRGSRGRRYAARFASAAAVAEHVRKNIATLSAQTRLWHDTWYDSTLPRWFLDRTFLNTSILATSTCHLFADGRFYAWEGVGCCAGTCTHVWHYAHAAARLFPALERDLRERTDFGIAFDEKTGVVRFRAEGAGLAIDGQSGIILRSYREHQMSVDDAFLKRNWPKIKRALECLIEQDASGDGILEGAQHNTLDADWFGPIAWLSGLYLAALRAGEEMAREAGDEDFARKAREIFEKGRKNIVDRLWGGEYFINIPDPKHPEAINSGTGCHIDQVMGQSWAFQVNLGRVFDEEYSRKALQALWKYNFAPDVGPYRAAYKPGRWYAMPGEAGLLMCTFPRKDWDFEKACGKRDKMTFAGYFNECMNGFEYQAAGHMVWEGMVQEGLAITRAVHDRYHPSRRNPWNEVECGDHYARSMASYGVFLAACGYEYHGPRGHLGFAPRLSAGDFRAAFTTAEGWGTFAQKREGRTQRATVDIKHGRLRLRTLEIALPENGQPRSVAVRLGGQPAAAGHLLDGHHLTVTLGAETVVEPGKALEVAVAW
jgi:non-lysosomal glucosylceramidase